MDSQSSPELPTGTVTFLFTDLQDSTRLWEKYPATMGPALLRHDQIIESLSQEHNGFLVRPRGEGDSRFAVFERAIDAVTFAAAIQHALHTEPWPQDLTLLVRMGVHTGEGEFLDGDYYGTAVNRCARLRGVAYGGQTLISQATYELLQDNLPEGIELLDLGQHPLKGLLRPEHIYQLMAPGLPSDYPPLSIDSTQSPTSSKLPAFLEGVGEISAIERPVFVAREAELQRLNAKLERTLQGQGGILFITGGAGRGKTALVDEFCARSLGGFPELIVAKGNCNAHTGIGDPYLPFRDISALLTGDLEPALVSGAITPDYGRYLWGIFPQTVDAIIKRGSSLIDVFVHGESLLARTETADPDDINRLRRLKALVERVKSTPGELEQNLLFEQFTNILLLLAESSPLILVLDDLQWADNATIDLIFHLSKRIPGHRILLLALYRPEEVALGREGERHPLESITHELIRVYGDIVLDLTKEEVSECGDFVDLLIDTEPNRLGSEFRQTLRAHTAGHPLFTIELLRTMQERGDLVKDSQGMWVEGSYLDWTKLPARVEAVVEERIGRLEAHLRELLSVASVEGENFTAQVVARVQEIRERQLLRELSQQLEKRHRLIQERGELNIDGHLLSRYRFAHQLYQRYLYNDLSTGERRLLHREIGEVLEEVFADAADERAVQLALHYSQAGVGDKALHYLTLAGKQALAKFAPKEAIGYFTQALSMLPEDHPKRFDLLRTRLKAYELSGLFSEMGSDVASLLRLAEILDDDGLRCDGLLSQADYFLNTELVHAGDPADRALEIALKLCDKERQARALYRLGYWQWHRDKFDDSKRTLEDAYALFQGAGLLVEAARCLHRLSLTLGSLNEHEASLDTVSKAVALSREIGDSRQEATGLRRLAIAHFGLNQYALALPFAQEALELHRELGDRGQEVNGLNVLGILYAWLKDQEKAEKYLLDSLELAKSIGQGFGIRAAFLNLGVVCYLPRGDYEVWLRFIENLLEEMQVGEDDLRRAYHQYFLADVLNRFGQYKESLETMQAAINNSKEILSNFELAGSYGIIAQNQAELGDLTKARRNMDKSLGYSGESGIEVLPVLLLTGLVIVSILERDQGGIKAALDQLLACLDRVRETKDLDWTADCLEAIARLYLILERPSAGLKYAEEALDVIALLPGPTKSEIKYSTLANILYALDRNDEAAGYLTKAYDRVMLVANNTQDEALRKSWLENVRINRQIIADYHSKVTGTLGVPVT
jgi:class 3 adenylate cyclase/tetratricopeptide (TPR) repeat protein